MNVLLFYPSETVIKPDTGSRIYSVRLTGHRHQYLINRHQITSVGTTVKAGIIGGLLGSATLVSVTADASELEFQIDANMLVPPRSKTRMIIGVPRPQTVKKIIQVAASFGVSSIDFVLFEKSIKSYLSSAIWSHESLQVEVLESLEQVADTVAPTIAIHPRAHEFFNEIKNDPLVDQSEKIIFDSIGSVFNRDVNSTDTSYTVAFGPEAGFIDSERALFKEFGFKIHTLGPRMLRLEHAACAALSRITAVTPPSAPV